jgi:AraC-like DNA-binding protein
MASIPVIKSVGGILSASPENNTDFRMLLLRHCKNGVLISGMLGISAVVLFLLFNIYFFGFEVAWRYDQNASNILVLWDKLLIISISALLILLTRLNLGLASYRYIFMGFAFICGMAILTDDILNGDVNFSSGYLTILLLISASCIPFKPWQMLLLSSIVVLLLYPGLLYFPEMMGVHNLDVASSQVVHLFLIAMILVGINAFLYHTRYAFYIVRRKADGFLDDIYIDGLMAKTDARTVDGKQITEGPIIPGGQLWVSDISELSAADIFVNKVKEIIEKHLGDNNFGVEWLAYEVAISPRQLQRRLKASIGISAGGLIRLMRIQRSAQLLEQKAGNISEIAYKVGFNDPIYFSRIFKKMYGVNPTKYVQSKKI